MSEDRAKLFVVGIGASAGGLKPIEDFFDHMPTDSGMAFVIVQHLSPDFKSLMDELLARHTSMAIHKVSDGVKIQPNSIYLIPPEKNMAISNGRLLLTDKTETRALSLPIDIFFSSLATEAADHAIAIVLSGTGSDGSRGIKDVREAGGLVLVQSVESAPFDGMPRAAIKTGIVDLICAPAEMPKQIVGYVGDQDRTALQQAEFHHKEFGAEPEILRLYRFYRQRDNIDFSLYKPGTISRRIERRMRMSAVASLNDYVTQIENDESEAYLLFRDLLVEVTHFFRDKEAFSRLQKNIIPDLIQRTDPNTDIRAWVCGCATGEEAYSVAMVLHDCLQSSNRKNQSFKVFATDVHHKSLEIASSGIYPLAALETVPEDLRNKHFVINNEVCNIKRELRQKVIFASNDLTRDPPFTRLDLICCRNVLIYLEPKIQKRILSMFHFGLNTKGVLFLGPSESVSDLGHEFSDLDRHWRIYGKKRDVRLPESTRMPMAPMLDTVIRDRPAPTIVEPAKQVKAESWLASAYEELLARHVPPSILVDESDDLVHCFGNARKLLTLPEGKSTKNVLKMLENDLSVSVNAALHRAKSESVPVVFNGVRVKIDDVQRLFQVRVEPYNKQDQSLYLISLEESEKVVNEPIIVENFLPSSGDSDKRIEQLERELNYTRETLQATVEELESSNEELQATNEELIASNEELQSTNEELHSVNEELYTVNSEHKEKIEELTELTSDMDNLFKSTDTGTIFLDKNFNIRMFTPSITAGFNVMQQDIGRPINHISYKLDSPQLLTDASDVLNSGISKEVEVHGRDQRIYLQRIQPYRVEDRIEGVILTLTDITALREAENARLTMQTLSEITQELPDFAYAVSHDLQAPLRHISQYTEIIEMAMAKDDRPQLEKAARVLKTSSHKLREMIDGLLAYSRINTLGKTLAPLDLKIPINAAILELGTTLEVNDATVELDPDLPTVVGDRNQLKLLFYHLIENSIKFRGKENPHIHISAKPVDGMTEIYVSDNGIGIQERNLDDVFTIFKRLGVKEGVPGAGVGLAICRRIALRHHGRIWLKHVKDGVTVGMTLRLPEQSSISSQLERPKIESPKNEKENEESKQEA